MKKLNLLNIKVPNEIFDKLSQTPIDPNVLSVRTFSCLNREGLNNLGKVAIKNYEEIKNIRSLGSKSLDEIITVIKKQIKIIEKEIGIDSSEFFNFLILYYPDHIRLYDNKRDKDYFLENITDLNERYKLEYEFFIYSNVTLDNFNFEAIPSWVKKTNIDVIGLLNNEINKTIEEFYRLGRKGRFNYRSYGRSREEKFLKFILNKSKEIPPESDLGAKLIKNINLISHINNFVNKLSQQEKQIFYGRTGYNSKYMTLEQLGKKFYITRERIRQLEIKIFDKMINEEVWDDVVAQEFTKYLDQKGYVLLNDLDNWYNELTNFPRLFLKIVQLSIHKNIREDYPVSGMKINNDWLFVKIWGFESILSFIKSEINKLVPDKLSVIYNEIQQILSNEYSFITEDEIFKKLFKICLSNFLTLNDVIYGRKNNNISHVIAALDFLNKPSSFKEISEKIFELNNIDMDERIIQTAISNEKILFSDYAIHQYERGIYGLLKHFPNLDYIYSNKSENWIETCLLLIKQKNESSAEELLINLSENFILPEWLTSYHLRIILKIKFDFLHWRRNRVSFKPIDSKTVKDIALEYLYQENNKTTDLNKLYDYISNLKSVKKSFAEALPINYPYEFYFVNRNKISLTYNLYSSYNIELIENHIENNLTGGMIKFKDALLIIKSMYPDINIYVLKSIIRISNKFSIFKNKIKLTNICINLPDDSDLSIEDLIF